MSRLELTLKQGLDVLRLIGPRLLATDMFQWGEREASLFLREPGFGPTEAHAFVL